MRRPPLLPTLLLLWTVLVLAGGGWRLWALRDIDPQAGPQALSRDGEGGLFVATGPELLHLDGEGRLRARHSATALGLADISVLAQGESGALWGFDARQHRLFRCDTRAWTCQRLTGAATGLSAPLQMAWLFGPDRRLLISDPAGERLLAYTEDGRRLSQPGAAWQAPAALSTSGGLTQLADGGNQRIITLDPLANAALETALVTQERPYAFIRRDTRWWVLEAGARLRYARLREYSSEGVWDLAPGLSDPVALLDIGHHLIVAGRADWQLMALDPDTGVIQPFGDAALRQALSAEGSGLSGARRERRLLPYGMAMLGLPPLFAALLWLRASPRAARPARAPAPPAADLSPAAADGPIACAAAPARNIDLAVPTAGLLIILGIAGVGWFLWWLLSSPIPPGSLPRLLP